jgi:hypothetical protein
MSLTTATMAIASMKKVLGIAHTDVTKGPGNEAFRTGFSVSGSTVFGGDVPSNPTKTALYDLTGSVELVRLRMVLDPTSNGHAYIAQLPADYQANSLNPNKSAPYFANSTRLVDTAGKLQIIPSSFGLKYEPVPYSGGTAVKGSGSVIAPGAARDWVLDSYNGIIFQQQTDTPIDYLECYIWVGDFLTDVLADLANLATNIFVSSETLAADTESTYVVDSYHPESSALGVVQWFISSQSGSSAHTVEVTALKSNSSVTNNSFSNLIIGSKLFDVSVDLDGASGDIRLLAKPKVAGITVDIKRLSIV